MEVFFWVFMGLGAAIAGAVLFLFIRLQRDGRSDEEKRLGARASGSGDSSTISGEGGDGGV
ncbi:MAG: hypothetical protein AAF416_01910 [Pseudomonadota bacterium]